MINPNVLLFNASKSESYCYTCNWGRLSMNNPKKSREVCSRPNIFLKKWFRAAVWLLLHWCEKDFVINLACYEHICLIESVNEYSLDVTLDKSICPSLYVITKREAIEVYEECLISSYIHTKQAQKSIKRKCHQRWPRQYFHFSSIFFLFEERIMYSIGIRLKNFDIAPKTILYGGTKIYDII